MYTAFTDEKVFQDPIANMACDLVNDILENRYTNPVDALPFFLTGMTARIIQGDKQEEVKVISFATTEIKTFMFCREEMAALIGAQGTLLLSDQAQIVYSDTVYIEIWLLPTAGNLITINGIHMQDIKDIPSYIL